MQFFVSQFLVVNFLINLYMYFQHLVSQFWIEFGSVGANKRAVAIPQKYSLQFFESKFLVSNFFHEFTYMQGGRGWLTFVDRSRIPQSFLRARICKFLRQKRHFL